MKRNEKTIFTINVLLISSAIAILSIPNLQSTLKTILETLIIATFAIAASLLLKKRKVNKSYSKIAAKSVTIVLFASLIVGFNLGLFIGFTRTFFPPIGNTLLFGFFPTVIMIIAVEVMRKSFLDNIYDNKFLTIFVTIVLIIVCISAEFNIFTIDSIETGFIVTCTIILPIVAENILSTYLVKRAGIKPALIYRLSRGLYLYVLPIAPNFSQYLYSVMWVIVPFFCYYLAKRDLPEEITKRGGEIEKAISFKNHHYAILAFPIIAILITLTILVSGILRYKMIAIATGSMVPVFERGDAIIYDKEGEPEIGDVLAFVHDGKVVTHRIIKISEHNTRKTYYTKGDANNTADNYEIEENAVLGKAILVIKYIGLPTVLFNETIGNI